MLNEQEKITKRIYLELVFKPAKESLLKESLLCNKFFKFLRNVSKYKRSLRLNGDVWEYV